jgi:hypothetical protein
MSEAYPDVTDGGQVTVTKFLTEAAASQHISMKPGRLRRPAVRRDPLGETRAVPAVTKSLTIPPRIVSAALEPR